jgi:hypothetical protein
MPGIAEWAIGVLGLIEQDRLAHRAHGECMDRLRKEGVIR